VWGKTYVFDGDQITRGLLDGLVYDTETATSQLLQHVIVVGHGGFSESRVHCCYCCAAWVKCGVGVAASCDGHSREGMGLLTIEVEA